MELNGFLFLLCSIAVFYGGSHPLAHLSFLSKTMYIACLSYVMHRAIYRKDSWGMRVLRAESLEPAVCGTGREAEGERMENSGPLSLVRITGTAPVKDGWSSSWEPPPQKESARNNNHGPIAAAKQGAQTEGCAQKNPGVDPGSIVRSLFLPVHTGIYTTHKEPKLSSQSSITHIHYMFPHPPTARPRC